MKPQRKPPARRVKPACLVRSISSMPFFSSAELLKRSEQRIWGNTEKAATQNRSFKMLAYMLCTSSIILPDVAEVIAADLVETRFFSEIKLDASDFSVVSSAVAATSIAPPMYAQKISLTEALMPQEGVAVAQSQPQPQIQEPIQIQSQPIISFQQTQPVQVNQQLQEIQQTPQTQQIVEKHKNLSTQNSSAPVPALALASEAINLDIALQPNLYNQSNSIPLTPLLLMDVEKNKQIPQISQVQQILEPQKIPVNPQNRSNPLNSDVLEKVNRPIFAFNQKLDQLIFKPVARTYQKITPEPIRKMVDNFFGNIDDVYSTANHLLQGEVTKAIEGTTRVMINSVIGLGGLIDVATPVNLTKKPQDLGQTLGVWGVPGGPYIMMPVLGPATVRDAVGKVATMQVSPTGAMNDPNKIAYTTMQVVNTRAGLLETTDFIDAVALDPYITIREAYLQRKAREDRGIQSRQLKGGPFNQNKPQSLQVLNLQGVDALKLPMASAIASAANGSSMAASMSTNLTSPASQERQEQQEELDDGFVAP